MIRRKATILQKTCLPGLIRPARWRLAAELGAARTARERVPIRSAGERRIDQLLGQAAAAQLCGNAERTLATPGVPVDIVFREAPVIENAACNELGDHLPRGGVLKTLGTQLRTQFRAGEVPSREQRDGRRARHLRVCALCRVRRFG